MAVIHASEIAAALVARGRFVARFSLPAALWLGMCAILVGAPAESTVKQLFRAGNYTACAETLSAAAKAGEMPEALWVLKLQAELESGRYAEAAKSLEASLRQHPSSLQLRWLGREAYRLSGQSKKTAALEAEMVAALKRSPWQYSDAPNQLVMGRWMLSQHTDPKKVLSTVYNEAKRRQPDNAEIWIAIGELALEKYDFQLAGEAFQQAVKLDADHPDAQLGLAKALAASNSEKAEAALNAALKTNPNHIPSLLFLVDEQIDSERYDEAEQALAHLTEVNPRQPLALAYRAVLAHLKNLPADETKQVAAALSVWPENPAVDHLIGRKLSQKYRFAEGAQHQRQALNKDPHFLAAKAQLAQDLLRLGQEAEGLKLAQEVYDADGYNVFAHNLVTLQESLVKFRALEADGLIVRMDAREAEIYGSRVLDLLQRAKQTLGQKYQVTLDQPIVVEIFPRQQDFAIRTFGLPGGAGFLGVCFGTVITANSPASQGAHPSCWEATLWHEFCHVITLSKTKNKMPRWLSEGISVYEERLADPTWGQAINPKYRELLLRDDLTPVSRLSGAFLNPKTPLHLQFAYFESSLVVRYLIEKQGHDVLNRVLVDLGVGMPINESLARYSGTLEALDADFAKYARDYAQAMAPEADWSAPELPRRATAEVISDWLKEHPNNYAALRQLAEQQMSSKAWADAKVTLETMCRLYPHDGSATSPYALLARVYRETNDPQAERVVLEKLAALSASDLGTLDRLCDLTAEAGDWLATRNYVQRSLAVNPLVPATYRRAAQAAEKLDDLPLAIASYRALLLLDPFDTAELHFQLARAHQKQGELREAKRQALLALEETPRFRAAQRLLLEIIAAAPTTAEQEAQP